MHPNLDQKMGGALPLHPKTLMRIAAFRLSFENARIQAGAVFCVALRRAQHELGGVLVLELLQPQVEIGLCVELG